MTCVILEGLKDLLTKRVVKMNKKYGAEISLEFGKPFVQNNHSYVEVSVDGSYKIGGYEFVASLDFDAVAGRNIVKGVGKFEIPSKYFTRCECDHCKTDVSTRKHTVLLYKEGTGFIQVGKTCLKEYIGVSANSYASYLSFFETLDEYIEELNREHLGSEKKSYEVEDILEQTVEHVKKYGYITKAMIDRISENACGGVLPTSTSSDIYNLITERKSMQGELLVERHPVYADTLSVVSEIRKLISEASDDSSWINNIKALVSHDYITEDNIGLLASAYSLYDRNNKRKASEMKTPSEYVGNIGEKIEFTSTPECVYSIDSEYGYIYIYKFVVGNDIIIWKTSKDLEDVRATFKGTVKAHSEYRGVKQTEITRAKIIAKEKPIEEKHEEYSGNVEKALDEFFNQFA